MPSFALKPFLFCTPCSASLCTGDHGGGGNGNDDASSTFFTSVQVPQFGSAARLPPLQNFQNTYQQDLVEQASNWRGLPGIENQPPPLNSRQWSQFGNQSQQFGNQQHPSNNQSPEKQRRNSQGSKKQSKKKQRKSTKTVVNHDNLRKPQGPDLLQGINNFKQQQRLQSAPTNNNRCPSAAYRSPNAADLSPSTQGNSGSGSETESEDSDNDNTMGKTSRRPRRKSAPSPGSLSESGRKSSPTSSRNNNTRSSKKASRQHDNNPEEVVDLSELPDDPEELKLIVQRIAQEKEMANEEADNWKQKANQWTEQFDGGVLNHNGAIKDRISKTITNYYFLKCVCIVDDYQLKKVRDFVTFASLFCQHLQFILSSDKPLCSTLLVSRCAKSCGNG